MKALILFLIFISSVFSTAFSQKILVLDLLGGRSKRIKYNSGDYISIRVLNDKTIYKGYLEVISDTAFYVNDNYIHLDSLSEIIKYNKAPKLISMNAFFVGGILGILSGFNNGLTKGDVFPEDGSYIVPLSFIGLGAVFLPFYRKTYKINKNRIIKILDLTPIAPIEEEG